MNLKSTKKASDTFFFSLHLDCEFLCKIPSIIESKYTLDILYIFLTLDALLKCNFALSSFL